MSESTLLIRSERDGEAATIETLTETAFAPMPYADGTEAAIIQRLRSSGRLVLSLVAVKEARIVGQVTFSRVTIDGLDDGWFGLGPVSVAPEEQGSGIGSALIREGLRRLREKGALGCALLGDPGYYKRFGFLNNGKLAYRDFDRKYVQALAFGGELPKGQLEFDPAFDSP